MISENRNSSLNFRTKVQKKMFLLKNKELFGVQTINVLLKINLCIDIASQYIYPVKNLAEIGIICDSNIIAYQKNRLSTTFYMSANLIEKRLQSESRFPINTFSDEELSEEFLFLIKSINDNVSNWCYFYIPFSIDSYHIQKLIENKKCGIKSILKNIQDEIDNVSKMKEQLNFNQSFSLNYKETVFNDQKNIDNFELIENSVNDRFFFKKISHQLPNKNEKDSTNELSSNEQNKFLFRHQDKL